MMKLRHNNNAASTTVTSAVTLLIVALITVPSSISNVNVNVVNAQQTDQQQTTSDQVGNNVFIEDLIPNPNRIMDLSFGYWCSDAAFDCAFRMFTDLAGELVMVDSVSTYIYIYILIILILIIQYLYYLFVV